MSRKAKENRGSSSYPCSSDLASEDLVEAGWDDGRMRIFIQKGEDRVPERGRTRPENGQIRCSNRHEFPHDKRTKSAIVEDVAVNADADHLRVPRQRSCPRLSGAVRGQRFCHFFKIHPSNLLP